MAHWLQQHGHHVVSIYHEARGLDDDGVLQKAVSEDLILVTNDKDFGEMVFRERKPHQGVILLRLEDERPSNKIRVLERLIDQFTGHLAGNFVVATENAVRTIRNTNR